MTPDLDSRCQELIARGQTLAARIGIHQGRPRIWFNSEDVPALQAWIASVANFFRLCATPDTYFIQECLRIVEEKHPNGAILFLTFQKLLGLLESVAEEMKHGLIRKAEYVFVASTFDDFLEHAAEYHRAGKNIESAVLASAVFEDSVRRLSGKMNIVQAGRSLDQIIDDL